MMLINMMIMLKIMKLKQCVIDTTQASRAVAMNSEMNSIQALSFYKCSHLSNKSQFKLIHSCCPNFQNLQQH